MMAEILQARAAASQDCERSPDDVSDGASSVASEWSEAEDADTAVEQEVIDVSSESDVEITGVSFAST
eukprot:8362999-Karenia_brevis.AAC.1